jgi:glyceraldehyde 3-phosphate dehydrogenase
MSVKIAINGFGRIGRATFKNLFKDQSNLEVIAINDLTDPKTIAHLLKYDSIYGVYRKGIEFSDNSLIVNKRKIKVLSEKDPEKLPWKDLGINIVLECTGAFRQLEDAQKHITAGAKKVIISAPAKGGGVPAFMLGINEEKYDPKKDHVVDMGSCTTNCLAAVVKVLNDNFEIVSSFATAIHSYTTSQRILDLPHRDLRRARAAAINIIPTTTGAAVSISRVLPQLAGKIDAIAIRVPTPVVSILDFVGLVKEEITAEEVNYAFRKAAQSEELKGILGIEDALLVSQDYIGNTYSAVVDAQNTKVVNGNLVKVLAWYDNEWGYATRLAEFTDFIGKKM